MTEEKQVYKCNLCGNVVEILHSGSGELICCGQVMKKQQEKNIEEGKEKHCPIIERTSNGVIVKVGKLAHPMESEHYIKWIEVITEHRVYRKELAPSDTPEAEFFLEAEHLEARAYCNLHGLWKDN